MKMYLLLKKGIFQCHVGFQGCNRFGISNTSKKTLPRNVHFKFVHADAFVDEIREMHPGKTAGFCLDVPLEVRKWLGSMG